MRPWRVFLLAMVFCWPANLFAGSGIALECGLRGGTDSNRVEENYSALEIYLLKDLPWQTSFDNHTLLKIRFDTSISYLEAASDSGGLGLFAVGADLVLSLHKRIELEIGFRPTWMPDHEFGEDDFGGPMQFTSHVGVAAVWQGLILSYRLQHTSNAGIYSPNPGFNLHMIGLGHRF